MRNDWRLSRIGRLRSNGGVLRIQGLLSVRASPDRMQCAHRWGKALSKTTRIGIIGGGVAGLAAGIALARGGFEVKLFEAADKLGGCCASTAIGGYTFNDGAMYIAVPLLLDEAFARLGLDRASVLPLRQISRAQTTYLPDGTTVSLGAGGRVVLDGERSSERNVQLAFDVDALKSKWLPTLRLFAQELLPQPFSLLRTLIKGWRHLPKLRGTLAAELEQQFKDPAARAAMAGILMYTGLPPERLPVAQIVGLVALLDDGFFVPEGGMGAIVRVLADTFVALGGQVVKQTAVTRIAVEGGRVRALEIQAGGERERVSVDAVVSTASGMTTFGQLLAHDAVPSSMRRKAAQAPLSHRALSVQLGLSNRLEVASQSISVLPFMDEQHRLHVPGEAFARGFSYSVPTVTLPELAPAGGSVVEMFVPVDERWSMERWNEDTAHAAAEVAVDALAGRHALDVAVKRVRSPKDFRDDMRLFGGALYGLSPAATPMQQFPTKTPLEGLYLAGQTTYPGFGVSTAILSGSFAAQAVAGAA